MARNDKPLAEYSRLSRDKSEEGNYSVSIENQGVIIKEYARKNGLNLHIEPYIDDDYTGMNFNRPAFTKMLQDCRSGKLGGIVVKDLSRLGRVQYQTLAYVQEIFPREDIRFIAIEEGYDSIIPETAHSALLLSAKGMINEQHSIITSSKTIQGQRARVKERKYIGSKAPYGYIKNPVNKYELIIDPEAAEIVRRIFRMACEGMGYKSISGTLRREGVLNPVAYVNMKNPKYHEKSEYWSKPHDWHSSSISTILNNFAYLGHIFFGRRGKKALRVDKVVKKSEDTWTKAFNTHEPIITQETWNLAHEVLSRRTKSCHNAPKQIFAGLLKCSDCGYSLAYAKGNNKKPNDNGSYRCSTNAVKGKDYCAIHYISYNHLYNIVFDVIREKAAIAVNDREWFIRELEKSTSNQENSKVKGNKARLVQIDKDLDKLERRINTLYDDRADDILSKERFKFMLDDTENCISVLKQERETLIADLAKKEEATININCFLELISEFEDITELNHSLLNRLISKIVIGNKFHLGGKKYSQDVHIYFRFIGLVELKNTGNIVVAS